MLLNTILILGFDCSSVCVDFDSFSPGIDLIKNNNSNNFISVYSVATYVIHYN